MQLAAENTEAAQSTQFSMTMEIASGDHDVTIRGSGETTSDGKHGRIVDGAAG